MSNELEDLSARVAQLEALLTRAMVNGGELDPGRRLEDTVGGFNVGHHTQLDIDVFWLIFGGIMVFWMQAGFAMLEVGTVHKKNTKNILIKNMFDAAIGALCWWWFGHALSGTGDSCTRTACERFLLSKF
jgi:hypothetical protein